jgi:hypothetical protein
MGQALEATAEILGIGSDEAKRRALARFIIRVAKEDSSLDATALRDRAVEAFGGVSMVHEPAMSAVLIHHRLILGGSEGQR